MQKRFGALYDIRMRSQNIINNRIRDGKKSMQQHKNITGCYKYKKCCYFSEQILVYINSFFYYLLLQLQLLSYLFTQFFIFNVLYFYLYEHLQVVFRFTLADSINANALNWRFQTQYLREFLGNLFRKLWITYTLRLREQ